VSFGFGDVIPWCIEIINFGGMENPNSGYFQERGMRERTVGISCGTASYLPGWLDEG
jgi:hypothetical protein